MNKRKASPVSGNHLSRPESWVDQYGDYLYRYAISRIHDVSLAQDLVQETLISALQSYKSFLGKSSERTWLTSILRHRITDQLRKKYREQSLKEQIIEDESLDELFDEKGGWRKKPVDWKFDPGKLMEQKEFRQTLHKCMSTLSKILETVFRLREMDEMSTDEICKVMDISTTNCWVILHRARGKLRHCLENNWFNV